MNYRAGQKSVRHKAKKHFIALLAVGLASTTFNAQALEVYDDFSGKNLSAKRFPNASANAGALLSSIKVQDGLLQMQVVGRNDRESDDGLSRISVGAEFPDGFGNTIDEVQVRLRATKSLVRGCPDDLDGRYRSRMMMFMLWGNDGSSTGDEDLTGNINSGIWIERRVGEGDMRIGSYIGRCADPDCADEGDPTVSIDGNGLGRVAIGEWVNLTLRLDRTNSQFITTAKLSRTDVREEVYNLIPSVVPFAPVAGDDWSRVLVRSELDNCDLSQVSFNKPPQAITHGEVDAIKVNRLQFGN